MSSTPRPPTIPGDQLRPVLRLARRMLRAWLPGALALAVTLAAAGAVALLWPKQYQSEAVVYYREGMQWDASEAANPRRVGQRLRDVLLSRTQLAKVIEELGLYPELVRRGRLNEAVEEMRLATGFRSDLSDVFVVSFVGDTPEQAQRVTAKLSELLIGVNTRLRAEQAELAKEFLDAEKKRKSDELAAREGEQLRFLAKHPEFAFEQGNAMGATLRARRTEAGAGRDNPAVAALLREEQRLRRQLSGAQLSPQDAALLAVKNDAEAKLAAARRDLADKQNRFTEQHPDVRAAAAKVADMEAAYKRAVDGLPPGLTAAPAVPRAEIEDRLQRVLQELALAREPQPARTIPGPLLETSETAKRIVAVETEWARLTREVAEARERLARLDSEQFKASMTASMLTTGQSAQIVVIDPANLPARPAGMSLKKKLLIVFGLAFAVGFGVVLARATTDDLLCDPDDVEQLALVPVLVTVGPGSAGGRTATAARESRRGGAGAAPDAGAPPGGAPARGGGDAPGARGGAEIRALPARAAPDGAGAATALAHVPDPGAGAAIVPFASELSHLVRVHRVAHSGGRGDRIVMIDAPDSAAAASFRILRHRLGADPETKTILVTSPGRGDGKTWTALNLALALGEGGGTRVLLVEANFRTPAVARLAGFEPPVCLAEQLELHRTRLTAPWDVAETAAPWLHIAAVAPGLEPRPMLDGRALAICIEQLRHAGYDHLVIDSPAILGSADVNVIEESVDGIVMVARARRSRAQEVRRAVAQVGSGKLLGVVLVDA